MVKITIFREKRDQVVFQDPWDSHPPRDPKDQLETKVPKEAEDPLDTGELSVSQELLESLVLRCVGGFDAIW